MDISYDSIDFGGRVLEVPARSGANVTNALYDALELAARERCTVALIHNDRRFLINPESIVQVAYDSLSR